MLNTFAVWVLADFLSLGIAYRQPCVSALVTRAASFSLGTVFFSRISPLSDLRQPFFYWKNVYCLTLSEFQPFETVKFYCHTVI